MTNVLAVERLGIGSGIVAIEDTETMMIAVIGVEEDMMIIMIAIVGMATEDDQGPETLQGEGIDPLGDIGGTDLIQETDIQMIDTEIDMTALHTEEADHQEDVADLLFQEEDLPLIETHPDHHAIDQDHPSIDQDHPLIDQDHQ